MSRIVVPAKSDSMTNSKGWSLPEFPRNSSAYRTATSGLSGIDRTRLQRVWTMLAHWERVAVVKSHAPEISRWLRDSNDHGLPKPKPRGGR